MLNGVIIESPDTTFIEEGVEIGSDTVISGFVKIYGNSKIGKSCLIDGSTRIINSTIEDYVRVDNAVIEDCYMEENSNIGPYSRIIQDLVKVPRQVILLILVIVILVRI